MGYFIDPAARLENSDSVITASRDSTNVIDLQATPTLRDFGIAQSFVEIYVTEAFNNLTSLDIFIRSDSTTNLDTSETNHASINILLAGLTLGSKYTLQLPAGRQNYERYLGAEFVVNGTAPTTGKLSVAVVPYTESYQYFPDGSSIQ
jgi:hypothetical protein